MGKWIRRGAILVVLGIFLFSVGSVIRILSQYEAGSRVYDDAAQKYTANTGQGTGSGAEKIQTENREGADEPGHTAELAPISVDFQGLQEVNSDVAGWIYCEDSPINYPVVQGKDNDYYLRHNYDGSYNISGSVFIDVANKRNFGDSNTILYAHNMNDGSMFAGLEKWAEQEYYDEHPVMWLLTPEQDYKIILFSGYTTPAVSDTYTIFDGPCQDLDTYLTKSWEKSDFSAEAELDGKERYILLSTCAYVFDNARYVVHGKLVPVDSAGGVPLGSAGGTSPAGE